MIVDETDRETPSAPAAELASGRWLRPRSNGHAALDDDEDRPRSWVPVVLIAIVALALVVRLAAAEQLSSHVDEGASILAAHMVAEKGVPVFPSGTLYLQGATLSYLLAPVVLSGHGGLDDLYAMRLLSVVAGTVAVLLMYLLGRTVTGTPLGGALGALFLALDPTSVRWSAYVRMYAPLQMLCVLLLWLFVRAVLEPPARRILWAMVGVCWVAVFTHIGVLLFWPPMVLIALAIHRRALIDKDKRRDLALALGLCLVAPVILVGLNGLFKPTNRAVSDAVPFVSFVGENFLSIRHILHPSLMSWELLFNNAQLANAMPAIIVGACCLLIGRYFLTQPSRRALGRRRIVGLLLTLYWVPVVLVAAFTTGWEERYLIHVQPVGLLLFALLIDDLRGWQPAGPWAPVTVSANGSAGACRPAVAAAAVPRRRPVMSEPPSGADLGPVETGPAESGKVVAAPRVWPRSLAMVGLGAVVLLGAGLRIFHLTQLSLWLDEGFTVLYARQSWPAVLGWHGFYSPHPPLFFSMVKVASLAVSEALAGRLVSAVCGTATLPVFYALVAKLLDRRAALIATGVLALSPLHLYYSQEGRMYALLVLLVATSYLALVAFWQAPAWRWALLYGVCAALAMYVDYSAVFALVPQGVLLAYLFSRERRRAWPLLAAIGGAAIAYAPWLPQALATVHSANREVRRGEYLGAGPDRVGTAIASVMGLAGDGSYFRGSLAAPWNRWPELRGLLLLAILPVVAIGGLALGRRGRAGAVAACLLAGTIGVAILISLVSPGFAERTVLTATLGWAMLVGAAFSGRAARGRLALATASLAVVVLVSALTLSAIDGGATKQQWRAAAADVAAVSPLRLPLVTYSYGAVADTLVDVYQPGLLDQTRLVAIRDGKLEDILSNGVLPEVGLTRQDLAAGKLGGVLPASDPANDAVWVLYPRRTGQHEVGAALNAIGYDRVYHRTYDDPRYLLYLDLYARPNARIGAAQAIDDRFHQQAGWTLPTGSALSNDETGAARLTLSNRSSEGEQATFDANASGAGLYTLSVEAQTRLASEAARVSLTCLSAAGGALGANVGEPPPTAPPDEAWRVRRVAVACPAPTAKVRVSLGNAGGDVTFRHVTLTYTADSPRPGTQAG